jgi:hypothetical protein
MLKKAFVTTSIYALAKQLGQQGAIDEFKRQLNAPGKDSMPVVRTIHRLAKASPDMQLPMQVDGGATYIGMARSRAFHVAYKSDAPCWIALDDDIETTQDTCIAMLEALDDVLPRIVLTPYYERSGDDSPRLTCSMPLIRQERTVPGGVALKLAPGTGGGFGFVGMNRAAMAAVIEQAQRESALARAGAPDYLDLRWFDNGEEKHALFYERLEDGLWWGEDTSFFKWRVPESVSVEALLVGTVVHAGVPLNLASL